MACLQSLALPAQLVERARSPGKVSGRAPAFDFDRALPAVGKANKEIDIAELQKNAIGFDQPERRRGSGKSCDRLLFDEAAVPAPPGAVEIQKAEEDGKDCGFGGRYGFKSRIADTPHDRGAEPRRAKQPVENHKTEFRPPGREFLSIVGRIHCAFE
jgi:hypothetical protein